MGKQNICKRCARVLPEGRSVCNYCGATLRNLPFNVSDMGDLFVIKERYKDLEYKQATEGLDDEEYGEMIKLREYIRYGKV